MNLRLTLARRLANNVLIRANDALGAANLKLVADLKAAEKLSDMYQARLRKAGEQAQNDRDALAAMTNARDAARADEQQVERENAELREELGKARCAVKSAEAAEAELRGLLTDRRTGTRRPTEFELLDQIAAEKGRSTLALDRRWHSLELARDAVSNDLDEAIA